MQYHHITFCTKYRRQLISATIEKEMHNDFDQIAAAHNAKIIAFNTAGDHVHLLLRTNDSENLEKIVQHLKGHSSYIIRKRHPELTALPAFWSPKYFIRSCSGENDIRNTVNYIIRQKEHHGVLQQLFV